MHGTQELTAPRARVAAVPLPKLAVRARVALGVCALAAISFAFPSAPTYDPWAWIIWGREILHLDLSTVQGPSWKPLPVLLTTPFAVFGPLAPDLWLFVARAGAIGGVVMVFRLARRWGGVPGGAAAATAYALAPWTLRNAWLGNSEGLLVALALAAVERHLDGHRRQAFLLGLGAGLLRPEVWPFLGLYGLWLLWRERGERVVVAVGLVLLPVLWLVPEKLGSGDFLRAAHRAQIPNANSPAFAASPVRAVLELFGTMLTTALWVGLAVAGLLVCIALASSGGRRDERPRAVMALAAATLVLVGEVAYMTHDGYAGNSRYLILPAALVCVIAGVGVGWALRRMWPRLPSALFAALAVVAAVAFAVPTLHSLEPTVRSLDYESRLADDLGGVVDRAGGRERLLACGDPYAGPFQVPAVAWELRTHLAVVQIDPRVPAVAFRTRNLSHSAPQPDLRALGGEAGVRTFATADGWRIVGRCR